MDVSYLLSVKQTFIPLKCRALTSRRYVDVSACTCDGAIDSRVGNSTGVSLPIVCGERFYSIRDRPSRSQRRSDRPTITPATKRHSPRTKNQPATSSSPLRLTISVSVAEPKDLKANEGDRVTVGQLLADRSRERHRLEAQAQQLELTLQRLEIATVAPPQPPAPVPDASYLEEQATIERSKVTVDQAERALQQKQQEIEYL